MLWCKFLPHAAIRSPFAAPPVQATSLPLQAQVAFSVSVHMQIGATNASSRFLRLMVLASPARPRSCDRSTSVLSQLQRQQQNCSSQPQRVLATPIQSTRFISLHRSHHFQVSTHLQEMCSHPTHQCPQCSGRATHRLARGGARLSIIAQPRFVVRFVCCDAIVLTRPPSAAPARVPRGDGHGPIQARTVATLFSPLSLMRSQCSRIARARSLHGVFL